MRASAMYTCRECEREINQGTEICPYCGTDLTVPALAQTQAPAKKPRLAVVLLRWGVLLAALWVFLWYILPERAGREEARAEARAVEALVEVRAALLAHASAQRGSYPASLETLADRVRLPAQKALSEGYQLQYTPGPAGRDGLVHSYVLLARPRNYGYRNFYTDETGVLRATRENRSATAQDSPI